MDAGTTTETTVDITPLVKQQEYTNQLLVIENIFLFGILIFMTFKMALRGLWK